MKDSKIQRFEFSDLWPNKALQASVAGATQPERGR